MSVRPVFTRNTERKSPYSKGKNAVGICHRSGFKYPLNELKFEPGTNLFVHKSENDGQYSDVAHPQNYGPENRIERIGLRWSFRDVPLSVGTVVSAEALALPIYVCVCNHWFIVTPSTGVRVSAGSSIGAGVSGIGLDFTQPNNSMYLIVLFPGI